MSESPSESFRNQRIMIKRTALINKSEYDPQSAKDRSSNSFLCDNFPDLFVLELLLIEAKEFLKADPSKIIVPKEYQDLGDDFFVDLYIIKPWLMFQARHPVTREKTMLRYRDYEMTEDLSQRMLEMARAKHAYI